VTINGVDYTADAIADVTITRGRDTVYADPPAGYARVQLLDRNGLGFAVNIADQLTVTVQDSADQPVILFRGFITDVAAELYDPGISSPRSAAIYSILAVGPLAKLARRDVFFAGRAAETDGDRILAAIEDGLATAWEEAGGTWAGVDPAATWETYDAEFDATLIDAGLFDIVALDPFDLGYSALDAATTASNSGQGLLYETLDGKVGWSNADARGLETNPTEIPADAILALGVRSRSSIGDLTNRVVVQYDGGAETVQDSISLSTYTLFERRITTLLADQSAAAQYADAYVERHAYPTVNLGEIVIRLDTVTDDTLRDAMLEFYSGSYVRLPDLPRTIGISRLDGYVEGTRMRLSRLTAELRLNISDAALSRFAVRWSGVTPTIAWQDVSGTLTWEDATTVTV
jgi:hypothetical protein